MYPLVFGMTPLLVEPVLLVRASAQVRAAVVQLIPVYVVDLVAVHVREQEAVEHDRPAPGMRSG